MRPKSLQCHDTIIILLLYSSYWVLNIKEVYNHNHNIITSSGARKTRQYSLRKIDFSSLKSMQYPLNTDGVDASFGCQANNCYVTAVQNSVLVQ